MLCTTLQTQSKYKPGEVGFMAAACWQDNRTQPKHAGRCDLLLIEIAVIKDVYAYSSHGDVMSN